MSMICYTHIRCGVWRSLVARTAGGREVAGSNPVAPIKCSKGQEFPSFRKLFFLCLFRVTFSYTSGYNQSQ